MTTAYVHINVFIFFFHFTIFVQHNISSQNKWYKNQNRDIVIYNLTQLGDVLQVSIGTFRF